MEWALIVIVVMLMVVTVSLSLVFLRIVGDMHRILDKERERHTTQLNDLVDRVVSTSYAEYKGWKTVSPPPAPIGGEEVEEEETDWVAQAAHERPWSEAALVMENENS